MANHFSILAWKILGRRAWGAIVHGIARARHNLVTKPPPTWDKYERTRRASTDTQVLA